MNQIGRLEEVCLPVLYSDKRRIKLKIGKDHSFASMVSTVFSSGCTHNRRGDSGFY
jgi:hypothetical protein